MERRRYRTAVEDSARWEGFVARAGDVVVCTPAKCGTTWMQSIVASLLFPTSDAPGPVLAISPWVEMQIMPAAEVHAQLAAQTHRRFMKSPSRGSTRPATFSSRATAATPSCRSAITSSTCRTRSATR